MNSIEEKLIGIVGGVGPYAGLDLAKKIHDQTIASTDQDHLSVALISESVFIKDRTLFLLGEVKDNPGYAIANVIKKLDKIGVTVVGIPCNTAHSPKIFDVITQRMNEHDCRCKLVHMIDEVGKFLNQHFKTIKKVGILSTTGTLKTNLYPSCLQRFDIQTITPDTHMQNEVHDAIYNQEYGVKAFSNPVKKKARNTFLEAISVFEQRGAEAVILGCTEIPLAISEKQIGNCHLIDPTGCLARALIREVNPQKLRPYG
jgi:aspartate racemase